MASHTVLYTECYYVDGKLTFVIKDADGMELTSISAIDTAVHQLALRIKEKKL